MFDVSVPTGPITLQTDPIYFYVEHVIESSTMMFELKQFCFRLSDDTMIWRPTHNPTSNPTKE